MAVATISHLTVRYGSKTAVSDLSVEIPEGCVGLLGPNGAGKTTLLKTLLGFVSPASGSGEVLGMNAATEGMKIRQRIGLMPEVDCHIPGMNADDGLLIQSSTLPSFYSTVRPDPRGSAVWELASLCGFATAFFF